MTTTETREALQAMAEQLVPVLYADLRQIARRERGRAAANETLRTTALVNEAYLKLRRAGTFNDRSHFLAAAAIAMRQVLVDYVRTRLRDKRGASAEHIALDTPEALGAVMAGAPSMSDDELLAVHEALDRLAQLDARLAQVVECRFFAGYSEVETAEALSISERTVRREWTQAKAWLYRELHPGTPLPT